MLYESLMGDLGDPNIRSELRYWGKKLKEGIPVSGHRLQTRTRRSGVRIDFKELAIVMSDEQASQLSDDLASLLIEKRLR